MAIRSDQVTRYLAALSDPDASAPVQWSVAQQRSDLVWAGWQPASVLSLETESPQPLSAGEPVFDPLAAALDNAPPKRVRTLLDRLMSDSDAEPVEPKAVRERREEQNPTPALPPGLHVNALGELAMRDRMHFEQVLGRVGWLFVTGSIMIGDERVPCCFPLFERTVSFVHEGDEIVPHWQSALRRNWLIKRRDDSRKADPVDDFLAGGAGTQARDRLAADVATWLRAFGVELTGASDSAVHPFDLMSGAGTTLVPGAGFYLAAPRMRVEGSSDLHRWATRSTAETALAALYQTVDQPAHSAFFEAEADGAASGRSGGSATTERIRSSLPLNGRQREAIQRTRTDRVVAVSGPPGTGKTHTIVAAAADAVARGESVLIATKSDFAAESADELLATFPTPHHVRFGRPEHRRQVADMLSAGSTIDISEAELGELIRSEDRAWTELESQWQQILSALDRKAAFERARANPDLVAAGGAPRVNDPDFDFAELDRLVASVGADRDGVRHRRSMKRLKKLVGAVPEFSAPELLRAISGARAERAINDGVEAGLGSTLDELWDRLDQLERDARATSAVVDVARRTHGRRDSAQTMGALATALRNTLATETQGGQDRPILATSAFLDHVPFWVGTLDEIGSLLPMNPAMFDLVVFDEANQIDQTEAVPALARAKRAMIVGDPRQLRHTTSVTAEQQLAALARCDIASGTQAATMLDVRANSLFDVAASVCPVTVLDEHFRSVPHLIDFSARRWYGGTLRLMTQHPRSEGFDAIDVHRVRGRCVDGVNQAEVAAVIEHLEHVIAADRGESLAVISPFANQANAIERAALERFDLDIVQRHRLRIGTVDEVQGTERDTTILSLAIDEAHFDTELARIEDPHLFNVLITRARHHIDVVHSFDPTRLPPGVLADWFRWEKDPPGAPRRDTAPPSRWALELVEALELGGAPVQTDYPVAGWLVDLVVGDGHAALGVETTVHPDGPEAHAERHLTLRRAGWDLISAYENNWFLRPLDAAVHIAATAARRAAAMRFQ